jgi:hypothetical protein
VLPYVTSLSHAEYPLIPCLLLRLHADLMGLSDLVKHPLAIGKQLANELNAPLCWLLETSVLAFGVLRLIERAFFSKHMAEKYNQYGIESLDFLPFWLY